MPKGRRGYYKQPGSIWREPWSNDVVATLVRLQAYLHDCWARDGLEDNAAGTAEIPLPLAKVLTGKDRRDVVATLLARCAQLVSMSVDRCGDVFTIRWPKYAEYQHNFGRFAPKEPAKKGLREQRTAKQRNTPQAPADESPAVIQFTADFVDGLHAVHPGFQAPAGGALRTWQREARTLLHQRPLEEAQALARWLFEDPGADAAFWRPNVMSVPKFRKQYDRLQAVRRRSINGAVSEGPLARAARNIAARNERLYGPR